MEIVCRPGEIRCADHATLSIRKSWYYFAKKRRLLGRHSSLADQSHVVYTLLYNDSCPITCIKPDVKFPFSKHHVE
jgi:hypothetical protein